MYSAAVPWALLAATAAAYLVGLATGQRWLLPLLNTVPAYAVMVSLLRRGQRGRAVAAMLLWAAAMAVVGTAALWLWPAAPDATVVHGTAYRDEMFHWIRSGEGSEGSPRLFLPQHLAHLAGFVALSLATASAASIFMGAVLMNYMDFYVASLARAGTPAWAAILLGWQPWAICRVAAFCILGVVLAEPLLARLARYSYPGLGAARRWLAIAGALIAADWVLKAALAPTWGRWLRALLPASGP
ncbi:MAG TPA: hypothetical protein VFO85_05005 [Vicinamibacteria bacterium]|nr:hypothetical protein [Vicinamibacteria bacterium]